MADGGTLMNATQKNQNRHERVSTEELISVQPAGSLAEAVSLSVPTPLLHARTKHTRDTLNEARCGVGWSCPVLQLPVSNDGFAWHTFEGLRKRRRSRILFRYN